MGEHDPILTFTGRRGCYAHCICGWQSGPYTSLTGAHVAFGQHLVITVGAA